MWWLSNLETDGTNQQFGIGTLFVNAAIIQAGSPYFYDMDFYNAQSTESLYILPNFQTIQQISWWSCGVSASEMVLNYYGTRGDWNEETLAQLCEDHGDLHIGTCLYPTLTAILV